jgi:prepilin signal peptidase PulO-like enzyme (type II secretory pathway)
MKNGKKHIHQTISIIGLIISLVGLSLIIINSIFFDAGIFLLFIGIALIVVGVTKFKFKLPNKSFLLTISILVLFGLIIITALNYYFPREYTLKPLFLFLMGVIFSLLGLYRKNN